MAKPLSTLRSKRPGKGSPARQGEHRGVPVRRGARGPAAQARPKPAPRPAPGPNVDPWGEELEAPAKAASVKITPARRPGAKTDASPMPRKTGPWKPVARPQSGPRPAAPVKAAPAASASGLKTRGKAPTGERLQKILAAAGVASRRACEAIILEGRVQVNGVTVTELGTRADPRRDQITLDFQPIAREDLLYIILNKPKGYVTTVKDDEGRPTVMAISKLDATKNKSTACPSPRLWTSSGRASGSTGAG